jgi:hypothetical protein
MNEWEHTVKMAPKTVLNMSHKAN